MINSTSAGARRVTAGLLSTLFLLAGHRVSAEEQPFLERVKTIALKGPAGRLDHLALDSKGERLFVANMANSSLDIVDLKAGKLIKQVSGQKGIQGIAYAPDLDRVFVGNGEGNACNVFSGKDYRLLKSIELADADNVRYDPATRRIYVAHAEKALAVIDAKTMEIVKDIKLPGSPEAFVLDFGGRRLFLNSPSPSQVVVVDLEKQAVVKSYPVKSAGANYPLALDQKTQRLFIGCRKKPLLVVMDADTGTEVTSLAIPADCDDLFHDARHKRIYASCGEGILAVIGQKDPDRYGMLARIPTVKLARTSLFDAATGRLFLVVPRRPQTEGPEVWVYQARP
jgi:hypothetical protein